MKIENNFDLKANKKIDNLMQEKQKDASFESKLQKAFGEKDENELKKVCKDFEGIFTRIVFKEMKNTVMKSDLIPDSNAREMFESLLDDKLSEESSKAGGIGLGGMLFKQMKKEMINQYKPK